MAIKIYKYKNILTKEFLIKEYINKQKPMYEIAKKIGCNKVSHISKMQRLSTWADYEKALL